MIHNPLPPEAARLDDPVPNSAPRPEADPTVSEWKDFLSRYASGEFPPQGIPPRPLLPSVGECGESTQATDIADDGPSSPETALYATPVITDDTARSVWRYNMANDYLPPPRSPHEALRESMLLEYDILGPVQTGNIQAAADLLSAYFPTALCTFTLFNNCIQTFFALSGPTALIERYGMKLNGFIQSSSSLCGHSVLLEDKIMFVPRMNEDWRFRSNPYVAAGIWSYIGSPVSLQCDPLAAGTSPAANGPGTLGIGAINIMFVEDYHTEFTDTERMVVANVTRMLIAQLRATWEGHIRTREARARKAVTDMIQEAFIDEQIGSGEAAGTAATPEIPGVNGGSSELAGLGMPDDLLKAHTNAEAGPSRLAPSAAAHEERFEDLARAAMDKLMAVTELDGVVMVDLRGTCQKPNTHPTRYILDASSAHAISTILSSPEQLKSPLPPESLLSLLNTPDLPDIFRSDSSSSVSGIESYLPVDTRAHLILSFFSLNQPVFLLIGIARQPAISKSTVNLARSLGSILLAKSIQARVLEADAAKLAFLSSISHELRTPLYGLLSGVNLAQSVMAQGDIDQAKEVLEIAKASGLALGHILNDVLDFGRSAGTMNTAAMGKRVRLEEVVQTAARMCIAQFSDSEEKPEVTLQCERRVMELDEAKYDRILINGLTNALKFCKHGRIAVHISCDTDDRLITRITDTGIGFDERSLPRLLEPFTKHDLHTPGAGLGLHITKQLAEAMGGTLTLRSQVGRGTTFEVVLPVIGGAADGDVVMATLQAAQALVAVAPKLIRGLTATEPARPKSLRSTMDDKLRVLIVDDNAICLKLLHTALRRGPTPLQCAQASDGVQAVATFEDWHPHLVLTDVSMPNMGGVEAAGRMRAISNEKGWDRCRIYTLTGLGSSDPRLKNAGMGGTAELDGWLVKGLDGLEVVHRIVAESAAARAMERTEVAD